LKDYEQGVTERLGRGEANTLKWGAISSKETDLRLLQ
jgi:hypothetical protein